MFKSALYLIPLMSVMILLSCNKNNNLNLFYFDETGCSDPWVGSFVPDTFTLDTYKEQIELFLNSENIEVNSIVFDFDSNKVELCYACHCKTGRVIKVEISSGKRRKMKDLRFYQD